MNQPEAADELRPAHLILSPGMRKMRGWVWLLAACFAMFLFSAILILGWQEGAFAVTWKRPAWFVVVVAVGPLIGAVFGMFVVIASMGFFEAMERYRSADFLARHLGGLVIALVVVSAATPLIAFGKTHGDLASATTALAPLLASDEVMMLRPDVNAASNEEWERTSDPFMVCAAADHALIRERAGTRGLIVQCRSPRRLDFAHNYLPAEMKAVTPEDAGWIAYTCSNQRGEDGWTPSVESGAVEQVRVTIVDRATKRPMLVGFVERVPESGGRAGVTYWARPRDVAALIAGCLQDVAGVAPLQGSAAAPPSEQQQAQ